MPKWFLTNFLNSKLGSNSIYKFMFDMSKYDFKMLKGLLKKNTRTFSFENGKSYKCERYVGKNVNIIIKKRNDQGLIGTCESVIKTGTSVSSNEHGEEKIKTKKSLFGKHLNTDSKSSSRSTIDTDIDSDSDFDSDSDSDNEGNNKEKHNDKAVNDLINSLCQEQEEKKDNKNRTVTYTVTKDGKTETFEKATEVDDTIDWEQAYHDKYANNSDIMYSLINGKKDKSNLKVLTHEEIEKLNLKNITEDEYFDPSSTKKLHMGKIMNITEEKKLHNKVKLWMSKKDSDFPLNSMDIKPIIQYMFTVIMDQVKSNENSNELDKQAYNYFANEMFDGFYKNNIFPLKISKILNKYINK